MPSFLITSFYEPKTIGKCLSGLLSDSFLSLKQDFEVLLACPDTQTLFSALQFLEKKFELKKTQKVDSAKPINNQVFSLENNQDLENIELEIYLKNQKIGIFKHIKDPKKGKPKALNLLFQKATKQILILTDGDTFADSKAIVELLEKQQKSHSGLISARPVSADSKNTFWGYTGHLLADSAHLKRSQNKNFPVSGYLFLINLNSLPKDFKLKIPDQVLSDDAYISYLFQAKNLTIEYQPKARVYLKYANNLSDFLNQKRRSLGGFSQLLTYPELKIKKNPRSLLEELKFFFFPLKYAKNLNQLIYSLGLYPLRFYLWVLIFIDQKIFKKDFEKIWVRIESTK